MLLVVWIDSSVVDLAARSDVGAVDRSQTVTCKECFEVVFEFVIEMEDVTARR